MASTLKSQSGASLVEIILTVLIISVTTLIIMSFSKNTFRMNKDSRCTDAAYLSAEEKIAELALQPFAASSTDKDTIDNIILDRSWTIADHQTIKRATVTVTYYTNGNARQITLTGAIN